MKTMNVADVLAKIHQTTGLPRLEIEGEKYPVNERVRDHFCVNENGVADGGGDLLIRADGYGGQVGSVNIEARYLRAIDADEGDRCVYVLKDKRETPDHFTTVIDYEYLLFRKSELARIIEAALQSPDGVAEEAVAGKRVVDDVVWEDSMAGGPCWDGPKRFDIKILLRVDVTKEEPRCEIRVA